MVVGLTGGIGSGKTLVSSFFKALGVPIYITDVEAKKLMQKNTKVIKAIKNLLGEKAYINNKLDRKFIASQVFEDKNKLNQLNAIVHPAVAIDFKNWYSQQNASFVVKESAILFETKADAQCDCTILVTAPKEVRLARVIDRDKTTHGEVALRMQNQWDDKFKIPLADYVITNLDKDETRERVEELYQFLKVHSQSC